MSDQLKSSGRGVRRVKKSGTSGTPRQATMFIEVMALSGGENPKIYGNTAPKIGNTQERATKAVPDFS
jgi:hypothetical protein